MHHYHCRRGRESRSIYDPFDSPRYLFFLFEMELLFGLRTYSKVNECGILLSNV